MRKPTVRKPLTGTDHHALALLCMIEALEQPYDAARFLPYLEAARRIVASPHAFDAGSDTLSVENYVLDADRIAPIGSVDDPEPKQRRRAFETIFDFTRPDNSDVTAHADDLRSLMYNAILEAKLLGGALMFELLNGGAR